MTKKTYILIGLAAVLGGIYLYYFTDLINTPRIQILLSNRPLPARRGQPLTPSITFMLDGPYQLTSVKVFSATALATNRHTPPVWYLVSKSNSFPVKGFAYGQRIPGMRLARTNQPARPLDPAGAYHLSIEAGRARGELDFQPLPATPPAQ